jgi:hypothetical protein
MLYMLSYKVQMKIVGILIINLMIELLNLIVELLNLM